ncbi:hypothetical protein B296_00001785 [Ensete ventricosum]|uniref:Uncharacterized protein n=1 Tax=Ensete ventricosum TaxID=4639 RepID=A0A427ABA3_ENSVE|nr:hypothetical protein B296_00001785 [Ensete ventricosum]
MLLPGLTRAFRSANNHRGSEVPPATHPSGPLGALAYSRGIRSPCPEFPLLQSPLERRWACTPISDHYHYTTTLANRLQDTGALINRLSSDNVALQVEVGQPKEEKKEMEARAIKLSSQLA